MVERSDKINLMLKGNMIDNKLEKFLKENFTLNTDFNEIISYLNRNPELIGYVYSIPSLYAKEFPDEELFIDLINLFDSLILRVYVETSCDWVEVADKLDLIEHSFYKNNSINILLTVRFKNIDSNMVLNALEGFNLINSFEIVEFIYKHIQLLNLIDKLIHLLNKYYPNHLYCLKFIKDPEFANLDHLMCYIKVNDFDNEWNILKKLNKELRQLIFTDSSIKHILAVDLW